MGKKFYEFAMAPKFHAQMGLKIESEMLEREQMWRAGGGQLSASEFEDDEAPPREGRPRRKKRSVSDESD